MKFGKSLSNQIEETLPEWRDQFLSYKELKKKLKSIDPRAGERPSKRQRVDPAEDGADGTVDGMTEEEIDFIKLLEDELEKFNKFFEEKEEDYIIRMKIIQDEVEKAKKSNEETLKIKKEIVDFHGEMVLLENYSALNYTGLVKILKKYDKRTGALIRLPFIQRVLQQPFFSTDLIYSLVKECERMLDLLFPKHNPIPSTSTATGDYIPDTTTSTTASAATEDNVPLQLPMELAEIEKMEGLYMKSTVSALRSLKEIRSRSSTVSVFSLPPLQISGLEEEAWKKTPVLEQVAK